MCRGTGAKICSARAGLQFPIGHIHWLLCKGHCAERVGVGAATYPAAVFKYQTTEILELARNTTQVNKETRIIPTTRNDEELSKLRRGVTIAQGGALPNLQAMLLPKKTRHHSKVYA
ncbi:histone H2A, sperm-like [Carcharodon carcharias]|uniref:histone H2A, sperm-like n=1 Tax=Carcharodon carcharias TaxID=13397 RepID=UPI001B7DC39A|nr:histone H2A, sperm-like [Carcharodon carcharias]